MAPACIGPNGQTIADKMPFMVAAMAAEMEHDLIHERTMDGLATANTQGRYGGRPAKSTTTPSPSPAT
ncbi:recombinase family protein [Streptosporangium amethystogenes]|uniref:recombinase family protein n=1 Tax=Streptosporangium amethystogenes TaxID=2002 RepID=UPI0004CC8C79|nr:recombinase family protein [Streptosporangium amethystogenes]